MESCQGEHVRGLIIFFKLVKITKFCGKPNAIKTGNKPHNYTLLKTIRGSTNVVPIEGYSAIFKGRSTNKKAYIARHELCRANVELAQQK